MKTFVVALLLFGILPPAPAAEAPDPYEALYDIIMFRQGPKRDLHGKDSASPLVYRDSRFLFDDDKATPFLETLDAFLAISEDQIKAYGPVKRALLQRHLWSVFDWTTLRQTAWWKPEPEKLQMNRRQFQKRIALLIRRLALSKPQILELPDTLLATVQSGTFGSNPDPADPLTPFFPSDLHRTNGSWIALQRIGQVITAKSHTDELKWRSAFHVYLRLPEGRDQTLGYIKQLADFRDIWVTEEPEENRFTTPNGGLSDVGVYVNPKTPQFPVGTQVALVEQALLISDEGELIASPLTVVVQLRAYLDMSMRHTPKPKQAFAEFVMQPLELMKGNAVMRAIGTNEVHHSTIFSNDPFQTPNRGHPVAPRLKQCAACHSGWGIHSVNTRSQLFEVRSVTTPRFREGDPESTGRNTTWEKEKDYAWGLLQGLWRSTGPR